MTLLKLQVFVIFVVFELKIMRKIIYKKVWDAIDFLAVTMQSQMPGTFNDLIIWNLRLSFQFSNLWTLSIRDNGEKKKRMEFPDSLSPHIRENSPFALCPLEKINTLLVL